jgi:dTDP-4-dehydrorhamnose 3,5-epimerase
LVRVLAGEILDVVVDIRPASATYGHYHSLLISADNLKQLFIPKGFAHGFSVLSESATIVYACDAPYNKEAEGGIYYADPTLNINWQLGQERPLLSEKDMLLPFLRDVQL